MEKITAIIPCNNEADNIIAALESIKWADEIIVVDSFSTDETPELAKRYTDKVFRRAYKGPADQKNWAITQATHQWILLLDADERITEPLKMEILSILEAGPSFDAYWIGRQNFFMDKKINYSGWQGDKVVRLIHRDKCRYDNKQVHEEIVTENINVSILENKMEHYTYKNLGHFLDKMRRYSEWSAQDYFDKTPEVGWYHLVVKPFFRFIKHFFLKKGFLDGKTGIIISAIMAWGVFLRYVKIREMHLSNKENPTH